MFLMIPVWFIDLFRSWFIDAHPNEDLPTELIDVMVFITDFLEDTRLNRQQGIYNLTDWVVDHFNVFQHELHNPRNA